MGAGSSSFLERHSLNLHHGSNKINAAVARSLVHPGRDGRAATQNRNRRLHPLSPSAPQATSSASTWSNFPFCRAQAFPMGGWEMEAGAPLALWGILPCPAATLDAFLLHSSVGERNSPSLCLSCISLTLHCRRLCGHAAVCLLEMQL